MGSLALAMASCVFVLPREYHIDCSSWPGATAVKVHTCITRVDGTVFKLIIEYQPKTTPEDVRDALAFHLKEGGYRGRKVGNSIFVLEGFEKSSIRSVGFTSKEWKPDVRVVYLVPNKK